ncbi:hypothetical protein NLO74_22515 [Pseudomonas tremae]|uniref:hypothetical protein n=1 Tax=Pseudomonas syringae group TaxID=136849 RepID=UPI001F19040A|nr:MULTISPECIES: hypothetical protein [Pseudomonas syringae group]MCQ3028765.1 hypothetical protein [Pseudomonas tremae]
MQVPIKAQTSCFSILQTSSVNYERYGSVALRELELNLVRAIGFGGGARTALLTSSGQRPTRRWKAFF